MGLEHEKSETSVLMDEDEFNRTFEPIMAKNQKDYRVAADRDPQDMNADLKISFEDTIGEPSAFHSFDSVWISSGVLFELLKFCFYRLLTALFAVPLSFIAGILIALLNFAHIWVVIPAIRACLMASPMVQMIWSTLMDTLAAPLFTSMGRCLSAADVKTVPN